MALKYATASGVVEQMQLMHDETEKLIGHIIQTGSLPSSYAWLISRSVRDQLLLISLTAGLDLKKNSGSKQSR